MSTWFKSTPESEALLAQERLVLAATELVYEAMQNAGTNKRGLAEMLGIKPSEVSQRLNGRRNLTLRTLAAMLHRLGASAELTLGPAARPVSNQPDIRQSRKIVARPRTQYRQTEAVSVESGAA